MQVTEVKSNDSGALAGKYISILGDSISTYLGISSCENPYYPQKMNLAQNETWWQRVIDSTGAGLCVNYSKGGLRVIQCTSNRYAALHTPTQMPDIIIFFMGINDFNNEVSLGSYDPSDSKSAILTSEFKGAYATVLDGMMTAYPNARIYCCTLLPCKRQTGTTYIEYNDQGVAEADFNQAIRNIARAYGAEVIETACCGITHRNMSIFMGDYVSSSEFGLHPNAAGHKLIAEQVIKAILPYPVTP